MAPCLFPFWPYWDIRWEKKNVMNDVELVINERLKLQPINHHFPVIFNNGTVVRELVMACARCHALYSSGDQICGSVTKISPAEYLIEGAGRCSGCDQTSIFDFKIYDDRTIASLVDGEWRINGAQSAAPSKPETEKRPALQPPEDPVAHMERHDQLKGKISSAIMTLRLAWAGVYIMSVMPAIEEIQKGSQHDFGGFFLTNTLLIFVGYTCSVILATDHFKRQR